MQLQCKVSVAVHVVLIIRHRTCAELNYKRN